MLIITEELLKVLKDYNGAISDYTQAIEINPNDATAYNNRGVSQALIQRTPMELV